MGLLVFASTVQAAEEDPITLGVLPRRGLQDTAKAYGPLAEYLSIKVGQRVELKLTPDYDTFWRAVSAQQYDVVHYNQYHYIRSHKELGYRLLLVNDRDRPRFVRPLS